MKAYLTKSYVDGLEPDPDPKKRLTVWDTELAGFGLTVTPRTATGGGVKTYIVQYRPGGRGTPTRRVTIGRHGYEWQPKMARAEAAEILRQRRQGLDPFEERTRRRLAERTAQAEAAAAETRAQRFIYSTFCEEFIEQYAKVHQSRSWEGTERALKDLGKQLGGCRVDTLTREEIRDALKPLTKRSKSAGIAAHKALRKLYQWANTETIFDWHPMREMKRPADETIRKRVLTSEELKAIWSAAGTLSYPFGLMYMLILATGLRLRDAANATWGEYYPEREALIIPAQRMKRPKDDVRGDFLVPLNMYALLAIKSISDLAPPGLVKPGKSGAPLFTANGKKPVSGFSQAKKALDSKIEEQLGHAIPRWTTHDLRRTMSTVMQALKVPTRIIDRMQDHRDKDQSKTSLHYQHWEFFEEKREAASRYGDYLAGVIAGDERHSDLVRLVDSQLLNAPRARAGENEEEGA